MEIIFGVSDHTRAYETGITFSCGWQSTWTCSKSFTNDALNIDGSCLSLLRVINNISTVAELQSCGNEEIGSEFRKGISEKRIDTLRKLSIGKYPVNPFPVNLQRIDYCYMNVQLSCSCKSFVNNKFLIQLRIRGIDNSSFKQLIAIYCLL